MKKEMFLIIFIAIAISGIFCLLFGIIKIIYTIHKLNSRELKDIIKKPISILTIFFSMITIVLIIINIIINILCGELSGEIIRNISSNIYIILVIIPAITTVMLSFVLSSSIKRIKSETISWILTIFFGIGSVGIFSILFGLIRYGREAIGEHDAWLDFGTFIKVGPILLIISIILNILNKIGVFKIKDKQRR
jgi:hypothetical protein